MKVVSGVSDVPGKVFEDWPPWLARARCALDQSAPRSGSFTAQCIHVELKTMQCIAVQSCIVRFRQDALITGTPINCGLGPRFCIKKQGFRVVMTQQGFVLGRA